MDFGGKSQIGHYEIIRLLGEGGMARVYLARNIYSTGIRVVLKVLKSSQHARRFKREAENLSRLDHQNICQIRDYFEFEGQSVIAMQYVAGKTLTELVSQWNVRDLKKIKQFAIQALVF